MLTCFLFIAV